MNTLTDPRPRENPLAWVPFSWPVKRDFLLGAFPYPGKADFVTIVENRRSERAHGKLRLRDALACIAFATRAREERVGDPYLRTRRPPSSAGALHPIEILLLSRHRPNHVFRYDAVKHHLQEISIVNRQPISALLDRSRVVLSEADGWVGALVADTSKGRAVYHHSDLLCWRDSGIVLHALHLAATAYGYGFCPMGLLGGEVIEAIGIANSPLIGVGTFCLGKLDHGERD